MMYEVEEKGKKIKQIIIYVIMLLSVLCCSAFAGVNVAKVYKVGEIKGKSGDTNIKEIVGNLIRMWLLPV